MKIAVIGAGNMGKAIMTQLLEKGYDVNASDPRGGSFLNKELFTNNKELVNDADIVFLAVKPQIMSKVLEEIKEDLKNKIIITIAAGLNLEYYKKILSETKICRVMPNLALSKGEGVIATAFNNNILDEDKKKIIKILENFGLIYVTNKEDELNLITALSGSGIAYITKILGIFIEEAKNQDLSEEEAKKIVLQTTKGSLTLLKEENSEEIISKVASKGGTTEQGLQEMEKNELSKIIRSTISKTIEKCNNLSK